MGGPRGVRDGSSAPGSGAVTALSPDGARSTPPETVGPILCTGVVAEAVLAALLDLNERALVRHQGGYIRVSVPWKCELTRAAVEAHLGRPFRLPGDLEMVMPSFKGRFQVDLETASWSAPPSGSAGGQEGAP